MRKLKIYVFTADLNEKDYLDVQIKSYKKFVENENTEFIVVNGSQISKNEIIEICESNGIKHIEYNNPSQIPDSSGNVSSNSYFYRAFYDDWFFDTIVRNSSDLILSMHPDMFFIDKIPLDNMDRKFYFIPRYHDDLFYVWEGIFLIDCEYFNKNGFTDEFIASMTGGGGDGGPKSWRKTEFLLERLGVDNYNFLEFWNLGDTDGVNYDTHLNGHVRYKFNINDMKLVNTDRSNSGIRMGNKSFPYEFDYDDYNDYYIKKFIKIKEDYIDKFNFPKPVNFDLVNLHGDSKYFALHLKSGSGYQSYFSPNYKFDKIETIRNIIESK